MYSRIESLKIKNFRNLGEVELSFRDSPIIALVGGNEAGKTSVIKAFAVCAMNGFSQRQKNFIKTGTDGFDVTIGLEDGTTIERLKSDTYNRLIIRKNGEVTYATDKFDRGEGVPKELQDIMGLVIEDDTKECLHIRTYEDRLLFVGTPTSTNYKVVYDALKVENLVKAITAGNKEVNTLKSEIDKSQEAIEVLNDQIRDIITYDTEPLLKIRGRLIQERNICDKLAELCSRTESLKQLNEQQTELLSISTLEPVDITCVSNFGKLIQHRDTLQRLNASSLKETDELAEIDTAFVNRFTELIRKVQQFSKETELDQAYTELEQLDSINSSVTDAFEQLIRKTDELQCIIQKQDKTAENIAETNKALAQAAEESDFDYRICPNCGEVVVID